MVIYCVMKTIPMCSPVIGEFFDTKNVSLAGSGGHLSLTVEPFITDKVKQSHKP